MSAEASAAFDLVWEALNGRRFPLTPAGEKGADAWYFLQFNANKKSITVNLKSPEGLALIKDLVKKGTETSEAMAEQRRLGYILEARREMMEAFKKEIQTEALKPWTRSSTGEQF